MIVKLIKKYARFQIVQAPASYKYIRAVVDTTPNIGGGGISGGIGLPICMVALQFLTHVIQLFIQLLFKGFQRLSRISWGWGDFGSGRVLDMVV
jgi:hypothetical protein